jgi:hypothetical protein
VSSRVSVWVVPTDEEAVIARHTQRLTEARIPAPNGHGVMASARHAAAARPRVHQHRSLS